jgi:hypothetical protein
VAGSNLNFNYVRFRSKPSAIQLPWNDLVASLAQHTLGVEPEGSFYEIEETSLPGIDRPMLPFAIPFGCSHTGTDTGIVDGANEPLRSQVFDLLTTALETPPGQMASRIQKFSDELSRTYTMVKSASPPDFEHLFGWNLQSQYDPHAQLISVFLIRMGALFPILMYSLMVAKTQRTRDGCNRSFRTHIPSTRRRISSFIIFEPISTTKPSANGPHCLTR